MSCNSVIIFTIYFRLFLVIYLFRVGVVAVVGHSEHPLDCVGSSCEDVYRHDHGGSSEEIGYELGRTNLIKKNSEHQTNAQFSREDGSDVDDTGNKDVQNNIDVQDLPRVRSAEQQKVVQEARRKFLTRRAVSATNSDEELEALNRQLRDSFPPSVKHNKVHSVEEREEVKSSEELEDREGLYQESQQLAHDPQILTGDPNSVVASNEIVYENEDIGGFEDDALEHEAYEEDGFDGESYEDFDEFDASANVNDEEGFESGETSDSFFDEEEFDHMRDETQPKMIRPDGNHAESVENHDAFEPHKHPKDPNDGSIKAPPPLRTAEEEMGFGSRGRTGNSFEHPGNAFENVEHLKEISNDGEHLVRNDRQLSEPNLPQKPSEDSLFAGMIRKSGGLHNLIKIDSSKDVKMNKHMTSHEILHNMVDNVGGDDGIMKSTLNAAELHALNQHPHLHSSNQDHKPESSLNTEIRSTNDADRLAKTVVASLATEQPRNSQESEKLPDQSMNEGFTRTSMHESLQRPVFAGSSSMLGVENVRVMQAAEELSVPAISETGFRSRSESPDIEQHRVLTAEKSDALPASVEPVFFFFLEKLSGSAAALNSEKIIRSQFHGKNPVPLHSNGLPNTLSSERFPTPSTTVGSHLPHLSESASSNEPQSLEKSASLPAPATLSSTRGSEGIQPRQSFEGSPSLTLAATRVQSDSILGSGASVESSMASAAHSSLSTHNHDQTSSVNKHGDSGDLGKSNLSFEAELDSPELFQHDTVKKQLMADSEGSDKDRQRIESLEHDAKVVDIRHETLESKDEEETVGNEEAEDFLQDQILSEETGELFEEEEIAENEMPLNEEEEEIEWSEEADNSYTDDSSEKNTDEELLYQEEKQKLAHDRIDADLKITDKSLDTNTENEELAAEMVEPKGEILEQTKQTLEKIKFNECIKEECDAASVTSEVDGTQETGLGVETGVSSRLENEQITQKSESYAEHLHSTKSQSIMAETDNYIGNRDDKIVSDSGEFSEKSASSEDVEIVSSKARPDFVYSEQHSEEPKVSSHSSDKVGILPEETAYLTDDSSFVTRFLNFWSHWCSYIFDGLPLSVQSLVSYFTLSLSPAKALTVCIISSSSFFLISVIVYYRKSHKSDSNVKNFVVQKKQDTTDGLQKEVQSLRVQLKDLQNKRRTSDAEKSDRLSQLDLIKAEREEQRQYVVHLENKTHQLQTQIEAINQTIQTEREQSYSYQQANQQLSSHISYLELQMSQLTSHWSAAQKSSAECQSQMQCMTEELSVMQLEKDRLSLELENWKERVQKLTQKMKTQNEDEKKHHEEIVKKEQEIQVMKNLIAQMSVAELAVGSPRDSVKSKDVMRCDDEILKNIVELSEMREKMRNLESERDSLKSSVSSEFESRLLLEDEVKRLKDLTMAETGRREEAEKKAKDAAVRIEVLSSYFQSKESEMTRKLDILDGSSNQSDATGPFGEGSTKDIELAVKDYKEKFENLAKDMLKADSEHRKQLADQEKKTHESWLLARQNEREANDYKNEASSLRLKVLELQTRLDDMRSNKLNGSLSTTIPDVALVKHPLPPPISMLPSAPPPLDEIYSSERLKFYGRPFLPFPPPFDIPPPLPPPHNQQHFDPRSHRRSVPFNTRQPVQPECSSPLLPGTRNRRSPSPTAGDSSFSSGSLKVSPVPTGKHSPHAGIQSPPKIGDNPGPKGRRPVAIRPPRSQRVNQGD